MHSISINMVVKLLEPTVCPLSAATDVGTKDFIEGQRRNSLEVITAYVGPSLGTAKVDDEFQFERHGCFALD
jgi:glutaminyl-tRNA synthetase